MSDVNCPHSNKSRIHPAADDLRHFGQIVNLQL